MTNILLALILVVLLLAIAQRGYYARKQQLAATAMDDLRQTLNSCIDEVRTVQTYGLRLQK